MIIEKQIKSMGCESPLPMIYDASGPKRWAQFLHGLEAVAWMWHQYGQRVWTPLAQQIEISCCHHAAMDSNGTT